MKTYTGHCHCGEVRFEVTADLEESITCNCSRCSMLGLILTFVPAAQFKLVSGEDHLTSYRFYRKKIDHLFCRICGIEPFGRGADRAGASTIAINIRCLDGVDINSLHPTPVDGKSW